MDNKIYEKIYDCGLVATVTLDKLDDAVPLARALLAGGMNVMELTLRTESAYDALVELKRDVPEILVGMGTVLRIDQLEKVAELGADFAVAPGMNRKIVKRAIEIGIPFAPGICTPSDIEQALEFGCRVLKFFPAGPCGGLNYLKSMVVPYSHLGIRYIPLGGINEGNLSSYMESDLILAAGGSWIAPREKIAAAEWNIITENTKRAVELIKRIRNSNK